MAKKQREYTDEHARAGVEAPLPDIECWENQYPGYEIEIETPEFTSVCPKTGLPDHGTIRVRYTPDQLCLELKSLKMYWLEYRHLGIFQENAVNRMLRDMVRACQPLRMEVSGEFTPRGGVYSRIRASYERKGRKR
jgi:7-cyano-7-deazaguanine reductase